MLSMVQTFSFCLSGTLRAFEDESKARLGVVECAKHELLQPFTVLHEKEGESPRFLTASHHQMEVPPPTSLKLL